MVMTLSFSQTKTSRPGLKTSQRCVLRLSNAISGCMVPVQAYSLEDRIDITKQSGKDDDDDDEY